MAYADAEDVEARLGRELDANDTTVVNARLGDAELLLRSRIPDLDVKVTESMTYMALVVMVESEMVLRLVRNPEGFTQETDGNYSYIVSTQVASGRLAVLDEEWALLGVRRGAFVLHPWVDLPYTERADIKPYTEEDGIRDGWA